MRRSNDEAEPNTNYVYAVYSYVYKHARSYGGRQHTVDETCVCIGHEAVSACVTA